MTHYYIATFQTTSDVMKAEALARQSFELSVMPVPSEISQGCGLALRFLTPEKLDLFSYLSSFPISGILHRMGTQKNNGHYPLETIMTFPAKT